MKQLCTDTCQLRLDGPKGRIYLVEKDQVVNYKDKHPCLSPLEIEDYVLDFLTAGASELEEAKWKFEDAAKVIKEAYNVTLKKGTSKADVIKELIDIRYRHADMNNKP